MTEENACTIIIYNLRRTPLVTRPQQRNVRICQVTSGKKRPSPCQTASKPAHFVSGQDVREHRNGYRTIPPLLAKMPALPFLWKYPPPNIPQGRFAKRPYRRSRCSTTASASAPMLRRVTVMTRASPLPSKCDDTLWSSTVLPQMTMMSAQRRAGRK